MDITSNFERFVQSQQTVYSHEKIKYSPTPFVIQSSELLLQLHNEEVFVSKYYKRYTNFHRLIRNVQSMVTLERLAIDRKISAFVVLWSSKMKELKDHCEATHSSRDCMKHRSEVASYLLTRFQEFTKKTQKMREIFTMNTDQRPFKLVRHVSSTHINSTPLASEARASVTEAQLRPKAIVIKPSFSERYVAEMGPLDQVKEYKQFAVKHKQNLLAESRQLSLKFGDEMHETARMKETVTDIFAMVSQFASLLQEQSEVVAEVHDNSRVASEQVRDTDQQLLDTLQRSKSFQRNLFAVIVGLSFLLLLLDALTP